MRITLSLILLFAFGYSFAQTPPPDDLSGIELQDWLWANYYDGKHESFEYGEARYHLYRTIDNYDEGIRCVYSGFERDWRSDSNSNNPYPINCEHTIPRSFYDERYPMFSDLHHLFPTYADWNTERSNYKFGEIPDQSTEVWMYLEEEQSNIPTADINFYSEKRGNNFSTGRFEPREDHKGDLARAILYFYTMYPEEGEITDVVVSLESLCNWHAQDPVNDRERVRNDRIEALQGDRNPFVDYPEVAIAAWGCASYPTSTKELSFIDKLIQVIPNPTTDFVQLDIAISEAFRVQLFDLHGKLVMQQKTMYAGQELDVRHLTNGLYIIQIDTGDKIGQQRFVKQ